MLKVIIIDDEPWSRELVKAVGNWESLQLCVIGEAEDGTGGLRLIKELEPDIVITDMRMPGTEGVELLKTMNEWFPSLKIIVMSGYDDFVYLKQAIRSRVVEYLLKPLDPKELNATLEQCIRELKQVHMEEREPWRTPLVFADTAVLNRYIAFRQLIYGHLQHLSKLAVLDAFMKLKAFIETSLGNTHQDTKHGNMPAKIGHDFILLLEEFLLGNEIALTWLWNEKNNNCVVYARWDSIGEMTKEISRLYEKAIDAVVELNRSKICLDLKKVQAYIDRYYTEPISLEAIAQHFFISKEHLSRSFKTFTCENISDYIIRKRMEKAKELISEQGMEIKHAAQLTGYTELAYFYRVFKKYFGFTPGELRRED